MKAKTCFRFIIFGLIGFSYWGCKQSLHQEHLLKIASEAKIPINEKISFRAFVTQLIYEDRKSFLMHENRVENTIDIFDWTKLKYSHSIHLPQSGPNSTSIYSFLYHNKDSIFIIPFFSTTIEIIDDSGRFVSKFNVPIKFKNSTPSMYRATNEYRPNYSNHILSICANPNINYLYSPNKVHTDNIINNINLTTDSIWCSNISYPKSYINKVFPSSKFYRTFNPNKNYFVISFPYNHHIFVANYNKVIQKYKVQSKYCKKTPFFEKYDETRRGRDRIMHKMYLFIIYDKYKDVYYRFLALQGNEKYFNKVNIANEYLFRPFVIMLLDNNFKILDEIKLPALKYNYYDFFVDKKGLWLSENNPENPHFDENYLAYRLITFSEKN